MWAGGKIEWVDNRALKIGDKATALSTIREVQKKGFDTESPMVFVKQHIEMGTGSQHAEPAIVEERSHVYLGLGTSKRIVRPGVLETLAF